MPVTHGAYSARSVSPLADAFVERLLSDERTPEFLHDSSYSWSLRAWGRAEAVCALLADWLDKQDVEAALTETTRSKERSVQGEGGRGKRMSVSRRTASVVDQLAKWEKVAASARAELGLPPAARVRIARDLGLAVKSQVEAVASLAERGRSIQGRRGAELPASGSAGGGI